MGTDPMKAQQARRRPTKSVRWALASALALLAAAVLTRTLIRTSAQLPVPGERPAAPDVQARAERLAEAVRIRTISDDDRPDASADAFRELHRHLETSFPAAHAALRRETVNALAAEGFVPRQTVYLVAGHDEEMGSQGGLRGASAVAAVLRARGVHASFVLDEGLLVTHGVMRGLQARVALVGVAEKGFATLRVTAHAEGGHSSMPPARTAIGAMSRAISRLEDQADTARLEGVPRQMLETLAPAFTGAHRIALSNLWLFGPWVQRQLAATPAGLAMLRTPWAPTVMRAGTKDNVLPERAESHVNLRLLPGDSADRALQRASRRPGGADVAVGLIDPAWPPSPVSSVAHEGYRRIASAIRTVFEDTVVGPGLMVGATDSRHLLDIADQVYRFSPIEAGPMGLPRFHGRDERLSIANLATMVSFYRQLLANEASAVAGISRPVTP